MPGQDSQPIEPAAVATGYVLPRFLGQSDGVADPADRAILTSSYQPDFNANLEMHDPPDVEDDPAFADDKDPQPMGDVPPRQFKSKTIEQHKAHKPLVVRNYDEDASYALEPAISNAEQDGSNLQHADEPISHGQGVVLEAHEEKGFAAEGNVGPLASHVDEEYKSAAMGDDENAQTDNADALKVQEQPALTAGEATPMNQRAAVTDLGGVEADKEDGEQPSDGEYSSSSGIDSHARQSALDNKPSDEQADGGGAAQAIHSRARPGVNEYGRYEEDVFDAERDGVTSPPADFKGEASEEEQK